MFVQLVNNSDSPIYNTLPMVVRKREWTEISCSEITISLSNVHPFNAWHCNFAVFDTNMWWSMKYWQHCQLFGNSLFVQKNVTVIMANSPIIFDCMFILNWHPSFVQKMDVAEMSSLEGKERVAAILENGRWNMIWIQC